MQAIADSSDEGTFYAPSVTSPENIPENLKAKGFNVINVKAPQDLPREASDKNTVLIIQLPSTNSGDSRSDNLQLNGLFEALNIRFYHWILLSNNFNI